jgi:serine/threonine-protein kinase
MEPRIVLHYELLEKLGSGGMGDVYKARDTKLNRFVALKVLPPHLMENLERRQRLFQEARSASALNHPHIVTIHDIFSHEGAYYLVMEFVNGKTLGELIREGLSLPLAIRYGAQIASALAAAHGAGIIHRDLKPGNVMVGDNGFAKLLDFGLAKFVDAPPVELSEETATASLPRTVEGAILGTVCYMSPEQAEGKRIDARSDIFSFGLLLYEMITGRRAFQGDSTISTLTMLLRDEPRTINDLVGNVPPELEQLVQRCLRKKPEERYQSAHEIAAALGRLQLAAETGILQAPPIPPAKRAGGFSKVMAAMLCVIALCLAFAGYFFWRARQASVQIAHTPAPSVTLPAPAAPAIEQPAAQPPSSTPETAKTPSPAKPKATAGARPAPAIPNHSPVQVPAPEPIPTVPVAPPPVVNPLELTRAAVKVPAGTPLRVALAADITNEIAKGARVVFVVSGDVQVGDAVVIGKGAHATGVIVEASKGRMPFRRSKFTVLLESVETADGKKAPLRSLKLQSGRPLDLGEPLNKPPRDKDVVAAKGSEFEAYLDAPIEVRPKK